MENLQVGPTVYEIADAKLSDEERRILTEYCSAMLTLSRSVEGQADPTNAVRKAFKQVEGAESVLRKRDKFVSELMGNG